MVDSGSKAIEILELDASELVPFAPANCPNNGLLSLVTFIMSHFGIVPGVVSIVAHPDILFMIPPGGCLKPKLLMKKEPGKLFDVRVIT